MCWWFWYWWYKIPNFLQLHVEKLCHTAVNPSPCVSFDYVPSVTIPPPVTSELLYLWNVSVRCFWAFPILPSDLLPISNFFEICCRHTTLSNLIVLETSEVDNIKYEVFVLFSFELNVTFCLIYTPTLPTVLYFKASSILSDRVLFLIRFMTLNVIRTSCTMYGGHTLQRLARELTKHTNTWWNMT